MVSRIYSKTALIVSSADKSADLIQKLLKDTDIKDTDVCTCGADARRLLLTKQFDIVIINAPLRDEFGEELAIHAISSSCGAMVIVKSDMLESVSMRVEDYGVLTLAKPFSQFGFYQAVKMVLSMQSRLYAYEEENKKLKSKIEELRIVSRAKCLLVEYLCMSEQQAHRYIEKQAMDMRMSKVSVAKGILKTYNS